MPAVGFGMGIERLIMILEKEGIEIPYNKTEMIMKEA